MTWVCDNCGNTRYFCGSQNVTKYGTEKVIVNSSGDVEDSSNFNETDCEVGDRDIHSCNDCDSENIRNLIGGTLERWKNNHFDGRGEFIKGGNALNILPSTKSPSAARLRELGDKLLSNKISIEEYKKLKDAILGKKEEIRKILVD